MKMIDVSHFNTSKCTNMNDIFNNCKALTLINFNNFIASSVTSMNCMLKYCHELLFLNLTSFNTELVKIISWFMVVQN